MYKQSQHTDLPDKTTSARALPLIFDTVLLGSIACVLRWFWVVYELHAIEQLGLAMKAARRV